MWGEGQERLARAGELGNRLWAVQRGPDICEQKGLRLRPPAAAFDPTGRIRAEPGTRTGQAKKAGPGNEVMGPVRRPLDVNGQCVNGM